MTTDGRKDSLAEPELDDYGIPVQRKRPLRWISWILQTVGLAGGVWAMYVSIVVTHAQAGSRWHTWHHGPEAPAWGVIGLAIITTVWRSRKGEKDKLGWWMVVLALALGIIAIWILTLVQPYHDGGAA